MKKCAECKSTKLRKGVISEKLPVSINHGKEVVFTAELPAVICGDCNANYISHEDLARLELGAAQWLTQHGIRDAKAIRFIRKAVGMRAVDLAELLDVTPETVSHWENGHTPIDVGSFTVLVDLVADALAGQTTTLERLKSLREPVKAPKRRVKLKVA
jgi:DNA-binding transcriptional regulator YiaG